MNLLDLILAVGIVAAALGGWKAGVIARMTSWIGLGVGFLVGVRILPTVLRAFELPTVSGRLLVVITVLVMALFIGQAIGLIAGHRLRTRIPRGTGRKVDRAAGAGTGAVSVLVALWLLVPTVADVRGWPSRQVRGSALARSVSGGLPDPPDTTSVIRRLVDERTFPQVLDSLEPTPDPGVPPAVLTVAPEAIGRVLASTVKVQGEACRRIQEGTGFVVLENLVVTNAHVVAGETTVEVIRPDGKVLPATVARFDPVRDLAILAVPDLRLPALGRANAPVGAEGAVVGHPGGQDTARAAPARISRLIDAKGKDIYGTVETSRQVYVVASDLAPGDSGGPLVDTAGRVVGVAFAIAPDRSSTAYALTSAELDATMQDLQSAGGGPVNTGACLS